MRRIIILSILVVLSGCATPQNLSPALIENAPGFSAQGTAHLWFPVGYLFTSISWIKYTDHLGGSIKPPFESIAEGGQGDWVWRLSIGNKLNRQAKTCASFEVNIKQNWDRALDRLYSETARLIHDKRTPSFDLIIYLVPDLVPLKKSHTSFSLSSIPLTFYFAVHIDQSTDSSCTISYPWGSPFAVVAHEIIHALADIGYLPASPDLLIQETRAYLFDRLTACALPDANLPHGRAMCCPLTFATVSEPRQWLRGSPDQLAQLVAAKAVRDKFGRGFCPFSSRGTASRFREFVRKALLNPAILEQAAKEEQRKISRSSG